ncbi:Maf family protein [Candidatus Omnitrophota bacterium]
MKNIILASASERRSRILSDCGIDHKVAVSYAEETQEPGKEVYRTVIENASRKAEIIAIDVSKSIVVGADTLVVHGNNILGKPENEKVAKEMLSKFSGSNIEVYTGLCVIDSDTGERASGYDKSGLVVSSLNEEEVKKYFKLLGPYDKAGGFSIEGVGSLIFDNIAGSYFNILGLPMIKLADLFRELGLDILDFINK